MKKSVPRKNTTRNRKSNGLSKERAGEIALQLLQAHAVRHGISSQSDFNEFLQEAAQSTDASPFELKQLYAHFLPAIIRSMLGCDSVSVTTSFRA